MLAATILPQVYLPMIRDNNYHLALAHLIGKDGFEQYTGFYKAMGEDPSKFVIMDNGLIEGDPRPMGELVEKARLINATEIVLPDIFQDAKGTLHAVEKSIQSAYSLGGDDFRWMAVAQGSDYDEMIACAKELLDMGIDTLAIPKIVTKMAGRDGRLLALTELQDAIKTAGVHVHLLGCWESPLELKMIENHVRQGKILPVRGVDSAIPYVYARAGLKMCDAERPVGAIDFNAEDADEEVLAFNIDMWIRETAGFSANRSADKVHRLFM